MSQLAGTWVSGDASKKLQYEVLENGAAMNLTGATAITLHMVRLSSGVETVTTITGALTATPTDGLLEFTTVGSTPAVPASRLAADIYECRCSFVLSAATRWTDAFRIAIVKFP